MDNAVNQLDKLAPALVALQADLKPVDKNSDNPFFKKKYADLPSVMKAVQPLLATHKLAISQFLTNIHGDSAIRTILLHESGQYIEDIAPLMMGKDDSQSQGAATTYARRYGVMAVLGVVAEEDHMDPDSPLRGHPKSTQNIIGNVPAASPNRQATEKQRSYLANLARKKGKDNAWIDATLNQVRSSQDASAIIDKLNMLDDGA